MPPDVGMEPSPTGERHSRRIFLAPGHEEAFGLMLLIPADTGVIFHHQAGGLACNQHFLEGFLVPIAGHREETILAQWFEKRYMGYSRPDEWTEQDFADLDKLLSTVVSYGEGDARELLSLDRSRLAEVEEAWIPVHSALGDGYLIFENSD